MGPTNIRKLRRHETRAGRVRAAAQTILRDGRIRWEFFGEWDPDPTAPCWIAYRQRKAEIEAANEPAVAPAPAAPQLKPAPKYSRNGRYGFWRPWGRNGPKRSLGLWGDDPDCPNSDMVKRYEREVAMWRAGCLDPERTDPLTVREVCDEYLANLTTGAGNVWQHRRATGFVCRLWGELPVHEFRFEHFIQTQELIVSTPAKAGPRKGQPVTRETVNALMLTIRRMLTAHPTISSEQIAELSRWRPLKSMERFHQGDDGYRPPGYHPCRDVRTRPPVDEDVLFEVLPNVQTPIRQMLLVQWLTGMRISEVCAMRGAWVERHSERLWWYRIPELHHKGGKLRVTKGGVAAPKTVRLGPEAIEILAPFARRVDPDALWFQPKEHSNLARSGRFTAQTIGQVLELVIRKMAGYKNQRDRVSGNPHELARLHFTTHQLRTSTGTRVARHQGFAESAGVLGTEEHLVRRRYAATTEQEAYLAEIGARDDRARTPIPAALKRVD